ncbi:MAG: PRC-barrel domain-containing protein [Candidatus Cyclobacteriaceae bacterium M2_1C_046]
MDTRDRNNERNLRFLNEMSDYKVASEDPDVRGWDVVDVNNQRVGKVDNLLVDKSAEKVRYLDVELDKDVINEGHETYAHGKATGVHEFEDRDGNVHMIVPIGLARVDENNNNVISDEINRSTIESGFLHRKGQHITPEHERGVLTNLSESERSRTSRPTGETRTGTTSEYENRTGPSDEYRTQREAENPGSMRETKKHGIPRSEEERTSGIRSERTSKESERTTGNERYESDIRNREMRRPESSRDTKLSQEARRSERVNNPENVTEDKYTRGSDKPYREEAWSFETNQNPRHGRFDEATRGPVQSNFYTHRYFDENRFYGRG